MRKFLLGLALLAPVPAVAQTLPQRGQSGYDTGPIVPCIGLDGVSPARCLMPGEVLYDTTGAPFGTAANPIVVSQSASSGGATAANQTNGNQVVRAPSSTPVQQGGTIAASGGTATITFVNTNDTEIINPSTATLWGSWGTPAVNGANSYPIVAGGSYRPPNRVAGTFTLLSTAANQAYTATRF